MENNKQYSMKKQMGDRLNELNELHAKLIIRKTEALGDDFKQYRIKNEIKDVKSQIKELEQDIQDLFPHGLEEENTIEGEIEKKGNLNKLSRDFIQPIQSKPHPLEDELNQALSSINESQLGELNIELLIESIILKLDSLKDKVHFKESEVNVLKEQLKGSNVDVKSKLKFSFHLIPFFLKIENELSVDVKKYLPKAWKNIVAKYESVKESKSKIRKYWIIGALLLLPVIIYFAYEQRNKPIISEEESIESTDKNKKSYGDTTLVKNNTDDAVTDPVVVEKSSSITKDSSSGSGSGSGSGNLNYPEQNENIIPKTSSDESRGGKENFIPLGKEENPKINEKNTEGEKTTNLNKANLEVENVAAVKQPSKPEGNTSLSKIDEFKYHLSLENPHIIELDIQDEPEDFIREYLWEGQNAILVETDNRNGADIIVDNMGVSLNKKIKIINRENKLYINTSKGIRKPRVFVSEPENGKLTEFCEGGIFDLKYNY